LWDKFRLVLWLCTLSRLIASLCTCLLQSLTLLSDVWGLSWLVCTLHFYIYGVYNADLRINAKLEKRMSKDVTVQIALLSPWWSGIFKRLYTNLPRWGGSRTTCSLLFTVITN
jgi:hypothetical protein